MQESHEEMQNSSKLKFNLSWHVKFQRAERFPFSPPLSSQEPFSLGYLPSLPAVLMSIKYIGESAVPRLKLETGIQESREGSGQFCEAAKSDGRNVHPIYVICISKVHIHLTVKTELLPSYLKEQKLHCGQRTLA